jgi:hypothetical protein
MGERRPTSRVNSRVREPVGFRCDPLEDPELLKLMMRGDPADIERVAELFGQKDPERPPRDA